MPATALLRAEVIDITYLGDNNCTFEFDVVPPLISPCQTYRIGQFICFNDSDASLWKTRYKALHNEIY